MKNGIKTLAMWLIIGVIFIVVLSSIVENRDSKLKYSDLIDNINSGKVEAIQIQSNGKTALVTLKDDKVKKEVNIPSMESFMSYIEEDMRTEEHQFSIEEKSESILVTILSLLTPFGLVIIFFIFWFIVMGGMNNGAPGNKSMSFGKSKARMMTPAEKNRITFDEIGRASCRERV